MAGASLLTLLDDIASVLDDVAAMTKVATKKTAGVLGDDLALNAQQVAGVKADRELPVVWAVAKGSVRNKMILVPAALAISALAPWAVTPLLIAGGFFLCFEGVEKLAHKVLQDPVADAGGIEAPSEALSTEPVDLAALENDKIRGAVRTDFILSAEIIVITLGTVAAMPLGSRVGVLLVVAAIMTAGVYGLVAGIVKLDDAGLYLSRRGGTAALRALGRGILRAAPWLMKALSVAGTAAMFLVGGGILVHGVPWLHHLSESAGALASGLPAAAGLLGALASMLVAMTAGILAGALALAVVTLGRRLAGR